MGNSSRLRPDDIVALVDPPEEHVAEVDGSDAVIDLLEPDGVLLERIGDEQQALLQADSAGVGDGLDEEMARVLNGRQDAGIGEGR